MLFGRGKKGATGEDQLEEYRRQYFGLLQSVEKAEELHRRLVDNEYRVEQLSFYGHIAQAREKVLDDIEYRRMYIVADLGFQSCMQECQRYHDKAMALSIIDSNDVHRTNHGYYIYEEIHTERSKATSYYSKRDVRELLQKLKQDYLPNPEKDVRGILLGNSNGAHDDLRAIKKAFALSALYMEHLQAVIDGTAGTIETLGDMINITSEHRIPMNDVIDELERAIAGEQVFDEDTVAEIRARFQARLDKGAANRHLEL